MSVELEICPECGGNADVQGYVNFGCTRDDYCSGCDACDLPCITCTERLGR